MIRLTLPIPDRCLSPNSRAHWATKARATKEARRNAWLVAEAHIRNRGLPFPHWERASVEVTFYWPTAHKRDADNAMRRLKPIWDGLQDAGIIEDDAGLIHYPARMEVDRENPRVEIVIREAA